MDIFQKLYEIENETGGDVSGIKKLIEDGQVTIASSMPSPDPKDSVREIEMFNRFNKDYPNYADGGMLVKPSEDGRRPGYAKNKMSGSAAQQAGNVAKQKAMFNEIGKLFINKEYKKLKTKTPKSRMGAGSVDSGGVLNSNQKTMLNRIILNGTLKEQNDLAKKLGINRQYMIEVFNESERLKDEGKASQQSKAQLVKVKIQKELFDEILNNKNATIKSMAKKFKKTEKEITKQASKLLKNVYAQNVAIGKGPEFDIDSRGNRTLKSWLPDNFETTDSFLKNFANIKGLKKVQTENMGILIKNAYANNPAKYTAAIKGLSEYNKLVNLLPEDLKLDLDHPLSKAFLKGSGVSPEKLLYVTPISRTYNRGFKESLSMAYDKALLNPNRDKKLIKTIENFAKRIGVNIGKGSTKKLDFGTTPISKKTQAGLAEELVQNLREQNIARKNLAKFKKTKEGKKIIREIFPSGRAQLNIPKVDTKQINKVNNLYLRLAAEFTDRCSLGAADGGRIGFKFGSQDCINIAKKGLEEGIKKGFNKGSNKAILAEQILKIGGSIKDSITLRGMFGPAAMAFLVGTEAGFVGYDMLSKGKTMREAVGDSIFNYMLGEKTKIDPQEELFKRYRSLGYDDNQMFRLMETIRTTNLINRGKNINERAKAQAQYVQGLRNEPDQFMGPDDQMMSDTRSEMAEQKLKDIEQEAIGYNKFLEQVDRPGGMKKEDAISEYFGSGEYAKGLELVDEADAAATVQKMQSPQATAGGFLFPKLEEKRIQTLGENLPGGGVNPAARLGIQAYEDPSSLPDNFRIIPMQPYGLKKGGRAGYFDGKLVKPVEIDFASAEDKAFSDMMKAYRYYINSGGTKSLRDYMRMSTGAGRKGGGREHFRGAGGGIAKLAGVDQGPAPTRGPNPQGLSYLMKRGKNT